MSQLFVLHSLLIIPMYVDVGTVKTNKAIIKHGRPEAHPYFSQSGLY